VAQEKVEVAKEIAKKHYEVEAGLVQVFRIVGKAEESRSEPIKLLEVNENTVPTASCLWDSTRRRPAHSLSFDHHRTDSRRVQKTRSAGANTAKRLATR
jgi:hypothetical protein